MTTDTAFDYMADNLASKAAAMKRYKQLSASMNNFADLAYDAATPTKIRTMLHQAIQNSKMEAYRQMRSEAQSGLISLDKQIDILMRVPLADKRKLLNTMPIIPVAVGAAFLGVSDAVLHDVNAHKCGTFGDLYLNRRCNSVNELLLLAQNPGWLPDRTALSPPLVLPNSSVLDSITYVDIWTASAYTNMKWSELKRQVQANGRIYRDDRTYRVSDLENIRIAKLNAKQ